MVEATALGKMRESEAGIDAFRHDVFASQQINAITKLQINATSGSRSGQIVASSGNRGNAWADLRKH